MQNGLQMQNSSIFRQKYWSGLPFPSTGDLPDPGIEPRSPALQAEPPGKIQRRKWQPTPSLLPGEFHGQSSLAGYNPWDLKRVGHDWMTLTYWLGDCILKRYFLCPWECHPLMQNLINCHLGVGVVLDYNCFTILYPFILYSKVNQLYVYIWKSESLSCLVMSNSPWPRWTMAHQAPLSMEFSKQEY